MTTALLRLIPSCKRRLDSLRSYAIKSNHICPASASCIDLMKLFMRAAAKLISRSTTTSSPIRDHVNNQLHVLLLASSSLLVSAFLALPLTAFKRQLDHPHTSKFILQFLYGTMHHCYHAVVDGGDLHRLYAHRHIHQGLIFVVANLIILAILLSNTLNNYPGRRRSSAPSFSSAAIPSPAMTMMSGELYNHRTDGRSNGVPTGLFRRPVQFGLQYSSPFKINRPALSPFAICCKGASNCDGGHPVLMIGPGHDARSAIIVKDEDFTLPGESAPALTSMRQKGIDQAAKTHDRANNLLRISNTNDRDDIDADKDLNHRFDEFIRDTFARIKKESQL